MTSQTIFAPAKLNLFLAITGKRSDGFHDLVSIAAPLDFGDSLMVELLDRKMVSDRFVLECSDPAVPADATNLVLRAAQAFAAAANWQGAARFRLAKRIPTGAGMGGGSSDAVATLKALNALTGAPLDRDSLVGLAASLGSDCPLFLQDSPVVMRGRGERIEPLSSAPARRLAGQRVFVFKPAFDIATAWSYQQLAKTKRYLPLAEAEARLQSWANNPSAGPEELLFNTLETVAFEKYLGLPALLDQLRDDFRISPRMTGSGSACFFFVKSDTRLTEITAAIRRAWGDSAFTADARIL